MLGAGWWVVGDGYNIDLNPRQDERVFFDVSSNCDGILSLIDKRMLFPLNRRTPSPPLKDGNKFPFQTTQKGSILEAERMEERRLHGNIT